MIAMPPSAMLNIGVRVQPRSALPPWINSGSNTMELYPDFKELLELLNAHEVDYLIVGGYALALHGCPRFTGDLDIYLGIQRDNARKVLSVLEEFGFGALNLSEDDFTHRDRIVQLGVPPIRIDFITSIDGVEWDAAWTNREKGNWANVPVAYLSREDFIANKRSSGRLKDLADIESLGEEP